MTAVIKQGDTTYYSGHHKLREIEKEQEARKTEIEQWKAHFRACWKQRHLGVKERAMIRWMIKRLRELGS